MSDRDLTTNATAMTSAGDLERRVMLAGSGGQLTIQDQIDRGEAFLQDGHGEEAKLLFQAALIQQGIARHSGRPCRSLLSRAGLPEDARTPAMERLTGNNTVELAIGELRMLARSLAPQLCDRLSKQPPRQRSAAGLHPTAVQRRAATKPSNMPVGQAIADLTRWLATASPDEGDHARAASAIQVLRGAENDQARFSLMPLVGGAPNVLAPAIALQQVRIFLRQSADLLSDPLGSLGLFHSVAALDGAGLGPYFSNIGNIIRRSANLFELAHIAEAESEAVGTPVGVEVWAVILGRRLDGAVFDELIDDLGDRNATAALHLVLGRILAVPSEYIDQPLVMRVRDAALDNLDFDLAARAQRVLVRLKPGDMLELRILGTIDASNGLVACAEQSLTTCLEQNPDDVDLRRQIEANRLRRFAPFALTRGFGSPQDRQLKRLHLRAGRPSSASTLSG